MTRVWSAGLLLAAVQQWLQQPWAGPVYIDSADEGGISRVSGLHAWLLPIATLPITSSASDSVFGIVWSAPTVVMQAIVAHRFGMLLLALTQRSSDDLPANFVVHLAVAACHPVVMPAERSSRARALWSRIRRRLTSAPAVLAGEPPCYGACLQGAWHFLKIHVTPYSPC